MDAPKVSVLMPVYNTKRDHLKAVIESVLSQTLQDFELIIINDHSTEKEVEEMVKSYTDPRIRYYWNEKNEGISRTRNKLIDLARGQYLAVLDHDDIAMPTRLEEQAAFLDAHPETGVVGSWFERFFETRSIVHKCPSDDETIRNTLMYDCLLLHPSTMIRRELIEKVRYEEEFSPAEDFAMWCRFIPLTRFHIIPKVLLRYRDHETNTSKTQKAKMARARKAVLAFARKDNADLWAEVQENMPVIVRVKLFGLLQVSKFERRGSRFSSFWKFLPFIRFRVKVQETICSEE